MTSLPINIEQLLKEAGFTVTELLILRHALAGEIFTIRELAAKTGKSCGALDGAIKKLQRKNILCKELVNTTSKYTLRSLDAISLYLKKETQNKCVLLQRRTKDVHAFLEAMDIQRDRPDMHYFDGENGIEQAYNRILEAAGADDILMYLPLMYKEEEHPRREMYAKLFRLRRAQGCFLRVLTHCSPLARRYQSRDAFEHRKTMFISQERNPLECEQIIAGNTLTYIHHADNRACMMTFPELVQTERTLFESLWKDADDLVPLAEIAAQQSEESSTWKRIGRHVQNVCMCQGATVTVLLLFATIYAICSVAYSATYGFCPAT